MVQKVLSRVLEARPHRARKIPPHPNVANLKMTMQPARQAAAQATGLASITPISTTDTRADQRNFSRAWGDLNVWCPLGGQANRGAGETAESIRSSRKSQ